ncbi:serine/threonine kinase [Minicystis rosea]|nr:serine/threonine kinase [Minicystis rosea]
MILRRAATASIAALLSGCSAGTLPPEGQVLLFVDTDALLPDPREAAPDQPALFERLRIEIFEPGAMDPCAGCSREFGIDHPTVFEARASVGVVTRPGESGYRARVRLYRTVGSDIFEPRPTSTLEAVVRLPAVRDEGIVAVHVVLRTDDLGAPQGTLASPLDASPGPATGGLAGTWAAAAQRDCAGAAGPGEVCVRGGAYWMGDLTIGESYGSVSSERLVVVSPFYLDATEVTVGGWRASGLPTSGNVAPHSSSDPGCTYTAAPDQFDQHPVNCITRAASEAYCAKKGARLPSEAEWEFVASARRSAYAVWGNDPAGCGDAVFARSDEPQAAAVSKECLALGAGVAPVGSGVLDRLALDGGTIVDLAGNLTEWVADAWAEQGEPCWSEPVSYDPLCVAEGAPKAYTIRGANFRHPGSQLRAALRADVDATGNPFSEVIGFRCARSAAQ